MCDVDCGELKNSPLFIGQNLQYENQNFVLCLFLMAHYKVSLAHQCKSNLDVDNLMVFHRLILDWSYILVYNGLHLD